MGSVKGQKAQRGIRLGTGEFRSPDSDNGRGHAQGLFLASISNLAPSVLHDLDRDVLGLLRRLPEDHVLLPWLQEVTIGNVPTRSEGTPPIVFPRDQDHPASIPAPSCLPDALGDWADRYHIDVLWVQSRALVWLAGGIKGKSEGERLASWVGDGTPHVHGRPPIMDGFWEQYGARTGDPDGDLALWNDDPHHRGVFAFHGSQYHASWQTRAEFMERANVAFQKALNAYADQVDDHYRWLGWEATTIKRNLEHFDWLVRHQVLGESKRSIAHSLQLRESTVSEPVNALADEIGLSLEGNEDYKGRGAA